MKRLVVTAAAVSALFSGSLSVPEAESSSTFVISSSHAGAVHIIASVGRTWTVNESYEGIRYSGSGLVALLVTRPADGSFVATATRWAPLRGEPSAGTGVSMASLPAGWGLSPGRYVFTLVCDSACSVTFASRPSGLPSRLVLTRKAVGVTSWRQRLATAGHPGGLARHDLAQDTSGVALASVGASATYRLANAQDAEVCRVSQLPVCDRVEDGSSQEVADESDGHGNVRSAFRLTRVYTHIGSGETTLHRIFITGAVDADATVVFVPTRTASM